MSPSRDGVSTESRLTRLDRVKLGLGLFLLGGLVRLLLRSYRIEVVAGRRHLDARGLLPAPAVVAAWHESILSSGSFVIRHLVSHGYPLTLLASLSRDGEIMARMAPKLGVGVARGSTSRGGLSGVRALYRLLSRDGRAVGLAPDGPRGPARRCQPGATLLSQLSGAPIVPIASWGSPTWRLGSWDRMLVPRPFARVAVALGEPFTVPEDLGGDELSRESERLESVLNRLTETARESLDR